MAIDRIVNLTLLVLILSTGLNAQITKQIFRIKV